MKSVLLCVVLASLFGCADIAPQVFGNTPSFQYCSRVSYERTGNMVHISADCALPIGGASGLPVPVPAGL